MTFDLIMRGFCLLGSGLVFTFAVGTALLDARGAARRSRLALGAYAGSSAISQALLLVTPITVRTWFNAVATVAGLAFVFAVLHRNPHSRGRRSTDRRSGVN